MTNSLQCIAEEIAEIAGGREILDELSCYWIERRLSEVLCTRHAYTTDELAEYLRQTARWGSDLASWQPLLSAAVEVARMRGERADVQFYGLSPTKTYCSTTIDPRLQFSSKTS